MKNFYISFLSLVLSSGLAGAQQIGFPGAEGAGRFTTGGRGTPAEASTVFEVTNLTDNAVAPFNTGSLRWALNQPGNFRTIVFRVSGTIRLAAALKIVKPNTTIAGQTAPGDGICLADYPVSFSVDNVIVRYIRFRMGDKNQNLGMVNGSGGDDSFGGTYHKNIIIDHCTSSWSNDEAMTIYGGDSTTLQWNIISEPLNYSYHFETGDADFEKHGYGGIWGGRHVSFHHNLFAHCQGRVPRFDGCRNLGDIVGAENADFRNNVLYNWGAYNTNGGEGGNYNIVNNYYKYGPSTSTGTSGGVTIRYEILNPYKQSSPVLPYGKYFVDGNYIDGSAAYTARNWLGVLMNGGSYADTVSSKVSVPFAIQPIATQPATEAYTTVLKSAGAFLPNRDTLDQRIVNDVINRTGKIIDVQGGFPAHSTNTPAGFAATLGAWPTLVSAPAPADNDHDGMPDTWELQRGLNPNDPNDRNTYNGNGFSNLELYLNGDSIVAAGRLNSCVSARSLNVTTAGSWFDAKDSSYAYTLVSTDTSNFIASIQGNGAPATFNISYYVSGSTRYDAYNHAYLNRNISMLPNEGSASSPVNIRIYILKSEFNTLQALDNSIFSINDLRILQSSATACQAAISGPVQVIVPTATGFFGTFNNGYYLEFQAVPAGTFFISSSFAGSILPLRLLLFNASLENNMVAVTWSTSNEKNVKNFVVERSADGSNFIAIGSQDAHNNGTLLHYRFADANPFTGTSYYRLKQYDLDGTFTYSNIVKLVNKKAATLLISPNPVKQEMHVTHPAAGKGSRLMILATDGKKLVAVMPTAGTVQTSINTSLLVKGNYLLVFSDKGRREVVQFVK